MHISFKLFLENQGEYFFGPGRAQLLRSIEELGSLRKAALKLGMSYRWAWGRLKKAEKAMGIIIIAQQGASGSGKSHSLTPEGRELLAWYESIEREVSAVIHNADARRPAFLPTGQNRPSPRKAALD